MAIDALARSLFQLAPDVVLGAEQRGQEREDRQSQQQRDALQDAMLRQQMQTAQQKAAMNTPEALLKRREQELALRNEYERKRLEDMWRLRNENQPPGAGANTTTVSPSDQLDYNADMEEYRSALAQSAVRAVLQQQGAGLNSPTIIMRALEMLPEDAGVEERHVRDAVTQEQLYRSRFNINDGGGPSSFVR